MDLQRIDNNRFKFLSLYKPNQKPAIVTVDGQSGGIASQLAAVALDHFKEHGAEPSRCTLKLAGRTWKVVPDHSGNFKRWFLSSFLDTFQDQHADQYRIVETKWSRFKNSFKSSKFYQEYKKFEDCERKLETIDQGQFRMTGPFTDPYTKLATLAFQRYEKNFRNKDKATPHDCYYRVILTDGKYTLVPRTDSKVGDKEINVDTVKDYRNYLWSEYGKEKITLIEKRYEINLQELIDEGKSLTPEHIYRFNIGANSIETSDLQLLLDRILKDKPELTGREKARMTQEMIKEIKSFKKAKIQELSPEEFNKLMCVYDLDEAAYHRSLTGREIDQTIQSGYTLADSGERKPWVDQQELFQTLYEMRGKNDLMLFYERIAHILVKKHMEKKNYNGDMSVGTLVPAPTSPGSKQRWYRVSTCVSNGFGVYSYTLESACNDPFLGKIKAYRSTSSANSAFRSGQSILNDLNSIRSPGYQGMGLGDPYEMDFIKSSTIPSWVAYTEIAKKQLREGKSHEKVIETLKNANKCFDSYVDQEVSQMSLKEIIKKNDGIINWVYNKTTLEDYRAWYHRKKRPVALNSYHKLLSYMKGNEQGDETIIAKQLHDELIKIKKQENYSVMKTLIQDLIDEIDDHILCKERKLDSREKELKRKKIHLKRNYKEAYDATWIWKSRVLWEWIGELDSFAKKMGEDVASKDKRGITYVGHSLGGACAQAHLVQYHIKRDRIPLPGKKLSAYVFDDPGVEKEDNQLFKEWGTKHKNMFKELGVEIELVRRHEAGDFVPLGGQEHLASVETEEEALGLNEWLNYDIKVLQRIKTAKDKAIQQSPCAHGTQFSTGKKGVDFNEYDISLVDQGIFDAKGMRKPLEWLHLRENTWHIPVISGRVNGNQIRTNPLLSLLVFWWRELDKEIVSPLLDSRGVFAVDEKGTMIPN